MILNTMHPIKLSNMHSNMTSKGCSKNFSYLKSQKKHTIQATKDKGYCIVVVVIINSLYSLLRKKLLKKKKKV